MPEIGVKIENKGHRFRNDPINYVDAKRRKKGGTECYYKKL